MSRPGTQYSRSGQPIYARRVIRRRCSLCNSREHWADECWIPDHDFYSGYAYALIEQDTELTQALSNSQSPSFDPTADLKSQFVSRYDSYLERAAQARDSRREERKARHS